MLSKCQVGLKMRNEEMGERWEPLHSRHVINGDLKNSSSRRFDTSITDESVGFDIKHRPAIRVLSL